MEDNVILPSEANIVCHIICVWSILLNYQRVTTELEVTFKEGSDFAYTDLNCII